MKPTWERRVMRLYRIAEHRVEVTGTHDFTPYYRRLHFSARAAVAELDDFPTQWFRLWVDHPTEKGQTQRAYTFVDLDRNAGTFSADFVLHTPSGPGGDWAEAATRGTSTLMSLTPARVRVPSDTSHLLVVGDLSALPALNTWMASRESGTSAHVVIADDHDGRADLPVYAREGVTITWVDPTPDAVSTAIAEAPAPPGTFAWGAGERSLVKAMRTAFTHIGLDRKRQFSQFYWTRGRATS